MNLMTNSLEKHIHFYKDNYELQNCEGFLVTHNETIEAIQADEELINTSAISALDFEWLLDKGYRIWLHENNRNFEIKLGNVVATEKEIRKGHNIMKLWIGGTFFDYFYNSIYK